MSELSEAEREALVAGFRHRLRLAGNGGEATRWWADDLAKLAADHFERIVAARVAPYREREAKARALADEWGELADNLSTDGDFTGEIYYAVEAALRAVFDTPARGTEEG